MPDSESIFIESLAFGGRGVGRSTEGKTVFIESAVPGDRVTLRDIRDRGRFVEARIDEIIDASRERRSPDCPQHKVCGGCPLQHIHSSALRGYKRRFVVDALQRIAGVKDADTLVADTVFTDKEHHYRNKIELQSVIDSGKLRLGFAEKDSHSVIPIGSCLLLPERYKNIPAKLSGALGYALKGQEESLKRVGLRVSRSGKDVELALWMEPGSCNRAFIAKIVADTIKTTSLVRVLVKGDIEKRDVRNVEVLSGKGFWQEKLAGFDFKVSAASFFQTNSDIAELMIEEVVAQIGDRVDRDGKKQRRIIDLYSGVGTFTLPLADSFDDVVAVEMAGSSIRDLRRNLEDNELYAEAIGGSVERALPDLQTGAHIVVDPPRSGLSDKARDAIVSARPRSIAYISCDPATLARDIKEFIKHGYTLERVKPFDMFPRTYHVECIALLTG